MYNKTMNEINSITMISDSNQYKYLLTNLILIYEQLGTVIKFNLIFYMLTDSEKKICKDFLKFNSISNVNIIFLDESIPVLKSKIDHITDTTSVRLFLPSILEDTISTLYIDNDIVVIGDISKVYNFFEKDKAYARRWSNKHNWSINFRKKFDGANTQNDYYNAGVIHLPLEIMRNNDFEKNAINFYKSKKDIMKFMDQDVLNALLKINNLPWKWNIARNTWMKDYKLKAFFTRLKIYHFLSLNKQWNENFIEKAGALSRKEFKKMQKPKKIWIDKFNELWV